MALNPKSPLFSEDDQETIVYILSRLPQIPELSEVDIQISRVMYNWEGREEVTKFDPQNLSPEWEKVKKVVITRKNAI